MSKEFIKTVKNMLKEERRELAEYSKDLWDSSFGSLEYRWLINVLIGLTILICSVLYSIVLFLWCISHPAILMLFILLIFLWCIYVLNDINHFWTWRIKL